MDLLAVVGVEIDALLRPADGDGDLAAGVDAGVRQGDAVADGRGVEVLPVDDPGQDELLVVDELLLGQDVQELFDGLDLVLALEVEDDLMGFEDNPRSGYGDGLSPCPVYRPGSILAHSGLRANCAAPVTATSRLNGSSARTGACACALWRSRMISRAQSMIWSVPRRSQSGWISSVTLWYFVFR